MILILRYSLFFINVAYFDVHHSIFSVRYLIYHLKFSQLSFRRVSRRGSFKVVGWAKHLVCVRRVICERPRCDKKLLICINY